MFKAVLVTSVGLGATQASMLGATVSLEGQHVELSKDQQLAEWMDLDDDKYNSKGFYHWKPQRDGFILKNQDSNVLSCKVKSSQHNAAEAAMSVGFDCAVQNGGPVSLAEVANTANSRMRAQLRGQFTPIQRGSVMEPIDLDEAYETYMNRGASHRNKDFSVYQGEEHNADENTEGEPDNSIVDPSIASEYDTHKEQLWVNQIDMGYKEKLTMPSRNVMEPHSDLLDVPYVDAGVDREVNNHMFEFFKKHPQYHTPQAHWRSARKWKEILDRAQGRGTVADATEDEHGLGGNDGDDISDEAGGADAGHGEGHEGGDDNKGLWQNTCQSQSKVPQGWPDVPTLKCKHYAISPMGYWGCKWLFEDGTCGYIQYYPNLRWDGLDSYVTNHHDMPEDVPIIKHGAFPGAFHTKAANLPDAQ
jgi:hypothetical protein